MKKMKFLLVPALWAAMTAPAFAEKLSLDAISAYLNGIGAARANFTQINDDNSVSTGTLMLKRPGRARFEYDPPEAALLLAGSGQVAIFDLKSNEDPVNYPLRQTPLWVILEPNVNLKQRDMVTGHGYDGTVTTVTAQDPENPEYGSIQLHFTSNPVQLRQWVINDGDGGSTTVALGELKRDVSLANSLFNIERLKVLRAPAAED
ncbi:outer membrane lipoprotein carrier protein LolA [Cognatishimia sp. SS12]|uniref:LolA family protein n=1 Tax=Cognatishimia sp. SS12 TaxID=2979465 RepID=UPI00232F6D27|nr:outer membrane lipoprotein carrier protein LolA [Cognatishimia sp. SS12]MDC0737933.1 outer membrane lipoprotein carrier protein LolA [Cognatishimia sp. SS12]